MFADIFPHKRHLQARLDFVRDVTKKGKLGLEYDHLVRVWRAAVTENPIQGDHSMVATWMRGFADDTMFGRPCPVELEVLERFFKSVFCGEDQLAVAHLSAEGYRCVQSYFMLSNLLADKLIVQDNDVKWADLGRNQGYQASINKTLPHDTIRTTSKVAASEMEGIAALWRIAIESQDEDVGAKVARMLLQLHSSLAEGLEDQVFASEDRFAD